MPSTTLKESKLIQFIRRKRNQAHTHELRLAQKTLKLRRQWVIAESKFYITDWNSKSAHSQHKSHVLGAGNCVAVAEGTAEPVLPSLGRVAVSLIVKQIPTLGNLEQGAADGGINSS